ncbi:MAG: hypothetical protein H8D32_02635, partial [Dehalococcoidia bacterium]|nr:hypothetical protein [Dehalococcoidia bacterium]
MESKESTPSIDALTRMPPEERQKHLDAKLREIVTYAYEKASAVKDRFDRAGVKPEEIRGAKD